VARGDSSVESQATSVGPGRKRSFGPSTTSTPSRGYDSCVPHVERALAKLADALEDDDQVVWTATASESSRLQIVTPDERRFRDLNLVARTFWCRNSLS
jgi:hypothetical protein